MREIKFRAWDKHISKMIQSGIQFNNTTMTLECRIPSLVLMQYTGLKDKNGKEIYEGDILKFDTFSVLAVNVYDAGGWNPFIDDCQTDSSWHYMIIGNIYENPELLGGGDKSTKEKKN